MEPGDDLQTVVETEKTAALSSQSAGVAPTKHAVEDAFWEAVDEKVLALCEFARTNLGYNGHDLSADGGNMPWTVASLLMWP